MKKIIFIISLAISMSNCNKISEYTNISSKSLGTKNSDTSDRSLLVDTNKLTNTTKSIKDTIKPKFTTYNYPNVISEKKIDKNTADGLGGYLDQNDRSDSEIYKIKFADGIEGTLVYRANTWHSYSVWSKKREKPYASKEEGLQQLWIDGTKIREFGEALGGGISSGNKGPLKKDGTPDRRYSSNK